jgi:lipoprotein NlpD
MSRFLYLLVLVLAGCASQAPAPVSDTAAGVQAVAEVRPGYYVVKKGDTLYRIALEHGQDYKDLIAWNKLENPNRIEVGQQLRVVPPEGTPVAVTKPISTTAPVEVKPVAAAGIGSETLKREPKGGKLPYSEENLAKLRAAEGSQVAPSPVTEEKSASPPAGGEPVTAEDGIDWAWPLSGKLVATFSDSGGQINKGLDIAAKVGDPVQAAALGKVVYVGTGLRGYGNLVIVRHSASFLSAYAHNSKVLVKEGAAVTKGQKIAEVGNSDADQPKLHFEIRRQGKPVDPAKYLPPK